MLTLPWSSGRIRSRVCAGVTAAVFSVVPLAMLPSSAPAVPARQADDVVSFTRPAEPITATTSQTAGNPLINRPWGIYMGLADSVYVPYTQASAADQALLNKIVMQPRSIWFGHWTRNEVVTKQTNLYVTSSQVGDPDTLVQAALFAMVPWEGEACERLPTAAEQDDYKDHVDKFAAGIGSAHTVVILQPDGPFALCVPGHSKIPSKLIGYASKTLSALPNTSVYIDAGADDWQRSDPQESLKILIPAGIKYARGFALNSTHYDSTEAQVTFSAAISKALARRGMPGKYGVINTAQNGRPFPGYTYKGPNFDNAWVCKTRSSQRCVTLGIPPTVDVANPAWGLSAKANRKALRYVDAYLWFGRPWLYMQASGFDLQRALQLARTTPYQ